MKSILGPGIAGLFLVFAFSAMGQTPSGQSPSTNTGNALVLPTHVANIPTNTAYEYDFIEKEYVWSNKPLTATASEICKTMKDHAFTETPYSINDDKDWNACLDTQIRSIGYMRWLRNIGFKANSKNRKNARAYLKQNYTMGRWGGYSFVQLRQAAKATGGIQ